MSGRNLPRCVPHGLVYDPAIHTGCTLCRGAALDSLSRTTELVAKDVAMVLLMILWVVAILGGGYYGIRQMRTVASKAHTRGRGQAKGKAATPAPMPSAPTVPEGGPVLIPVPVPRTLPMIRRQGVDQYGYPRDAVDRIGLRALLDAREFRALTRYVEQLQTEFEADFHKEDWVNEAVEAFDTPDSRLGELIDDWTRAAPESFAPWLVRAEHRRAVAAYYRGTDFAGLTAPERLEKYRQVLQTADPDLDRALELRPGLVAALQEKLWIANTIHGGKGKLDFLVPAIAKCPECFRVRSWYEKTLTPRWGGSFEQMEEFAKESQAFAPKNPRLKVLLGYADDERCAAFRDKENYDAALDACDRALSAGEFHLFEDDKAWVLDKLKREKDALFAWNRALEEYPQDDDYLAQRGVLIIRAGGLEAGVDDLRTAYRLDPFGYHMKWALSAATSALVYAGYQRTQTGDDTGAVAAYDLALSLSPGNTEALEWKIRAGSHLVGTDTVTKLEAACRDNPTDFEAFKKLDDALVRTQEYARIVARWTRYLEKRPDDARAYLERGGAYTHLRDAEHSIADLDRACAGGLQSGCEGARFVRARAAASAAPHR